MALKKLTSTVAIVGALLTSNAWCNSDNGPHDVLSVGVHDSGYVLVRLSGANNTEGCASTGLQNYIVLHHGNPRFKEMYALALTAFTTEQKLHGWVNGCTDLWGGNSALVPTATTLSLAR